MIPSSSQRLRERIDLLIKSIKLYAKFSLTSKLERYSLGAKAWNPIKSIEILADAIHL